MEQKKKETKATLERKIQNAIVFIPKDKETSHVSFNDKGLRLTKTSDYVLIQTAAHCHIFNRISANGFVRPYMYVARFIDIALENDCKEGNGYSYYKLLDTLKAKEDKAEYNICTYVDWWLFNCFAPLYSISEGEASSFLVYENYLHNIARDQVLLSEKKEDMTNKQFFAEVAKNMQEFIADAKEIVVFHKKTDEDVMQENIEAMQEQANDEALKGE